jgi:RNase H-like domain found in reverse transcriptase
MSVWSLRIGVFEPQSISRGYTAAERPRRSGGKLSAATGPAGFAAVPRHCQFLPLIFARRSGCVEAIARCIAGYGGKKRQLQWSEDMVAAFRRIKQLVCAATSLAHPDPAVGISLAVDASDTHVGVVLQQGRGTSKQPLAYYSKKLDAAQRRYSAFDHELLAAYLGICYFRYSQEGRRFTLYTNHKPLTFALQRMADPWPARQ